jgi:YbgC/YbaW family acyl-CoA thioester hydrolase
MSTSKDHVLTEQNLLISFGDTDPQGFIYFARAFELAHQAVEKWLNESTLGWAYWFQNPEFAVPIRKSSAEFLAPLRVGTTVRLLLTVKEIGTTSVTFLSEFYNSANAQLLASVQTTHVFVDKKSFQKREIPGAIRLLISSSH